MGSCVSSEPIRRVRSVRNIARPMQYFTRSVQNKEQLRPIKIEGHIFHVSMGPLGDKEAYVMWKTLQSSKEIQHKYTEEKRQRYKDELNAELEDLIQKNENKGFNREETLKHYYDEMYTKAHKMCEDLEDNNSALNIEKTHALIRQLKDVAHELNL